MRVAEVKAIKEKMSLETVGMTGHELSAFFSQGANEIQKMVDLRRRQNEAPKYAIDYSKIMEQNDHVNPN